MVLTLQLALVVFLLGALAHLLMRILQLALCGGGGGDGGGGGIIYIHNIYTYIHTNIIYIDTSSSMQEDRLPRFPLGNEMS